MKMPLGLINLDTPFAKQIGFTSDKFQGHSYLWSFKEGIIISNIESKKKGSFKNMMKILEKNNIKFRIPTPSNRMMEIGKKQGWRIGSCNDGVIFLTNEEIKQ